MISYIRLLVESDLALCDDAGRLRAHRSKDSIADGSHVALFIGLRNGPRV
jgi:hypothetical protein